MKIDVTIFQTDVVYTVRGKPVIFTQEILKVIWRDLIRRSRDVRIEDDRLVETLEFSEEIWVSIGMGKKKKGG